MPRKLIITTLTAAAAIFFILFSIRATTEGLRFCPYPAKLDCLRHAGMYEAPMHVCDVPEEIVPDSYIVFLHKGYTLETHKKAIGVNIDSAIRLVFNETAHHGLYYSAKFDKATLAAIRTDIGVDMVECDLKAHPAQSSGNGDL
jgi:hypothetical protein